MPQISAVIITYNEEDFIENCLSSVRDIADEIIVVDSFSTDSTEEICNKYNVKFSKHKFEGYVEQKNYALSLATYPHILSLDADEALSERLRDSIRSVKENFTCDGYEFSRLHCYCGKWIKHSRLYPDRQMRLFDSRKGKWMGFNPHDKYTLNPGSRTGRLKGDLYHWNYMTFEEHMDKMNRFSSIGAEAYFKAGRKAGIFTATNHMVWSFFRSYILCAGFLDGYKGFVSCSITAWGSFLKYVKLRNMITEANKTGKPCP